MSYLEKINRILVSCLLALVFVQAGLLFYLKNMQDEAEHRLVKNTTTADIECGAGQYTENAYWSVLDENVKSFSQCQSADCKYSHVLWEQKDQDEQLNVISISGPAPFSWQEKNSGVVKVNIENTEAPQVLALVSEHPMEWNLKLAKGVDLKKVIVATPSLVWLSGLPKDVPIEYLPKEKMCSYPIAWQEAFNPDNQYRVLLKSLRKVSGLKETSFQAARTGQEFFIPVSIDAARLPASVEADFNHPEIKLPVSWARDGGHVYGEWLRFDGKQIKLPKTTQQVVTQGSFAFAIIQGLLKKWDGKKDEFVALDTPMILPRVGYVKSMAIDRAKQILYIYNEERSGELFSYNFKQDKWALLGDGYKSSFSSLYYDETKGQLLGLSIRGGYFSHLTYLSPKGKLIKEVDLKEKIAVDKKRWRWTLAKSDEDLWLKLVTTQNIQGYWQQLSY